MLDDLFSSSKGPGVIGLLLGLVVLGGFGFLGLAVFDGRLNGDFANRQLKTVKQNQQEIDYLTERKAYFEQKLEGKRKRDKIVDAYEDVSRHLTRRQKTKAELEEKKASASAAVQTASADWEAYKEDYRAAARARIVGKKFDEIKTADGTVFKDVTITKITALELTLRTSEAIKNVKLEDMPPPIQDELQFDPQMAGELAAAIAKREATREKDTSVAVRLRKLQFDIRQSGLNIERKMDSIEKNAAKQVANKRSADALTQRARVDWDGYRIDKAAGRPSRKDDNAREKERRAAAFLAQNESLDRKNDTLDEEIRQLEDGIESAKREIEKLKREVRKDAGKKP